MLAYVFWHRAAEGIDHAEYEEAQRTFHASLAMPSACFRLTELPFASGNGYEDWYLVEDWLGLGELNETAVDRTHAAHHNRAATGAGEGWGGLYELVRGAARIPDGVEWLDEPRGNPSGEFVESLPRNSIWRRQLVLGPAPEFCCGTARSASRSRI